MEAMDQKDDKSLQPRKNLTFKQRLFAQEYVKNRGNGVQAALKAYDATTRDSAKNISHQNLDKPIIQAEIKRIMEAAGLGMDVVIDTLKRAMVAGIGEKATNSDTIRGVDMLLKLHNMYPEKRTLNLNYTKKEEVASKDMLEVMKTLNQLQTTTQKLLDDMNK